MEKVTKTQIIEVVNKHLEAICITEQEETLDLAQVGLDSIIFVKIIVSLEEEFNCEIPDAKLIISEMNTIQKIYDVLVELDEIDAD